MLTPVVHEMISRWWVVRNIQNIHHYKTLSVQWGDKYIICKLSRLTGNMTTTCKRSVWITYNSHAVSWQQWYVKQAYTRWQWQRASVSQKTLGCDPLWQNETLVNSKGWTFWVSETLVLRSDRSISKREVRRNHGLRGYPEIWLHYCMDYISRC